MRGSQMAKAPHAARSMQQPHLAEGALHQLVGAARLFRHQRHRFLQRRRPLGVFFSRRFRCRWRRRSGGGRRARLCMKCAEGF